LDVSIWEAEVAVVACLFADQHAVASASFWTSYMERASKYHYERIRQGTFFS
jgi:hypothetical protein